MNVNDLLVELPCPDGEEYLPFQKAGIREIAVRQNVLLADEMGLGKTIQVLGYMNLKTPAKVLIICPNGLRLNWLRELDKWLRPEVRVQYEVDMCTPSLFIPGANLILCSYEGITKWGPLLATETWDLLVLDEAHMIKTPSAQRTKAVSKLQAEKRIYITGTPIVNYPHELWILIHHLDPARWTEFYRYAGRYLDRTHKFGRNLVELQQVLRESIMIRRLKKEVLPELPRKRRQIIELPAEGRLLELVEKEKKLFMEHEQLVQELEEALGVREGGSSETEQGFELLIEEMKSTRRYFFDEMSWIRHEIGKAKVPYVCDHLDTLLENRDKIVVMVHHHDVARAIHERFKKNSVLVFGPVSVVERQERMDQFWENPEINLFIGSLKVAGLGFNLQNAHNVVFAESDWSPGTLTQAEDRCHRIGQEKSLLVQHLVAEDSMDSFMMKKVIAKQKSMTKALDRDKMRPKEEEVV